MPVRNNSTGALTARQVLDQALTGLENLRLLLEEAEALSNCACNGLDSLPSSLRLHGETPSYRPPEAHPAQERPAQGAAYGDQGSNDADEAGDDSVIGARDVPAPVHDVPASVDDGPAPVHDGPAPVHDGPVPVPVHDIDFIDVFGIGGDPDDLDEDPEEEDKLLAVGRLQTLVLAEGKAVRRSFRYCRRLIRDLRRVVAALPRPAHPGAGGAATPAS